MFAVVEVVGIFFAPIVEVGIQLMLGLRDDSAVLAAPATFSAVRPMSTIWLIGWLIAMNGIGRPAAANNEVAVMVAVPGTPTVPIETSGCTRNSCRTIAMLCGNRLTMVSRTAGTSLFVIARQGVVETTPQLERLCQD